MNKITNMPRVSGVLLWLALVAMPLPAHAQALNYAGATRVLNVGNLIVPSQTYDPTGPLKGIPDCPSPYVFYLMDLRSDLKPRGWVLQNPLAHPIVTQADQNRWDTIDPTPAHQARYQIGAPLTKDMAAYWEVNLLTTPLNDLLKFDLLYLGSHTQNATFTPQEIEKLRKLVEAGGTVWFEDCWKLRLTDSGRFFLPNLQFHGSHIQNQPASVAIAADPTHPLLTTPYQLTQTEMNHLGDKNVGEYYQTGYVPPGVIDGGFNDTEAPVAPDHSQPEPDVLAPIIWNSWSSNLPGGPYPYISAGQYGAGYVLVSSGAIGEAISNRCTGTTGYNLPAPDWDKNCGSVCGNGAMNSDPEDLKFAYNMVNWASSSSTYRHGPQHAGYSPQSLTTPMSQQWQFPLNPGEAVESDPIALRGNVYASTTGGRLICLLQDPSQVTGATGAVELWEAQPNGNAPLSPICTVEVQVPNTTTSAELLLVASGGTVYAYDSSYGQGQMSLQAPPTPVWTSTVAGNDAICGPPVEMDGLVFFTTRSGQIWEINPATGQPIRNAALPPDPNNPTNVMPATEPILHFQDPNWTYMAAPPAAGYITDLSSSSDDPTLLLCVYATATQLVQATGQPSDGALMEFPVRVANEHYGLSDANARTVTGAGNAVTAWMAPPLEYNAIKNPEMDTFTVNGGTETATPLAPPAAGSGTMHITIQWDTGETSVSYYALVGNAMAPDFTMASTLPDGTWAFFKPTQPLKWQGGTRYIYNRVVLAANQFKPGVGMTPLNAQCSVHIDYDVDLGDPMGDPMGGAGTAGPSYHPERAIYDIRARSGVESWPGVLCPPVIGLDDSVYFGDEAGIFYSFGHYGRQSIAPNWKFFINSLAWTTGAGDPVNPVTLADTLNRAFTTDIHAIPTSQFVVRSAAAVGDDQLFVTVTDQMSGTSRVLALDPMEFQQTAATTTAGGAQGGPPITFSLAPSTPGTPSGVRNPVSPVNQIGQYDPVTGRMMTFSPGYDFTVDADSEKVTIVHFGRMYANLPIYVFYNSLLGKNHSFTSNPPSPPDETHDVLPGVNNVPYDITQKYLYPPPNGLAMGGLTYANGYPHPQYIFPSEHICNLMWQFPDPTWNPGVHWVTPASFVPPFNGLTPIGGPPGNTIGESAPLIMGSSVALGVSQLVTPSAAGGGGTVQSGGLLVLAADSRNGLKGYTDPENAAIYSFQAVQAAQPGAIPPGIVINDPGSVVTGAVTAVTNAQGAILQPFPPTVTFYDTQDFANSPGLVAGPATIGSSLVVGAGKAGAGGAGSITMMSSLITLALDSYRLVGIDSGGNVSFEIPSTTKTTLVGADQPVVETATGSRYQYRTVNLSFNRPSSLQKLDSSNVLIADTGNSRVVECDLGGNVLAEVTRYYDSTVPFQANDFYVVSPAPPTPYSIGNERLSAPTDAYQWVVTEPDASGNMVQSTCTLITDSDSGQIVLLVDRMYMSGPNQGQYVPLMTVNGPYGQPVQVVWYHTKIWGTKTPASGLQYHYRNAVPNLVPDANGQPVMTAVVATLTNYALNAQAVAGQPAWAEQPGSSIVVLYGMTYAQALWGTVKAACNFFQDLRSDARGQTHIIQNPAFLRQWIDGAGGVHWLLIDDGAFFTPEYAQAGATFTLSFRDTRQGGWGVYDLAMPAAAGQALLSGNATGNFEPACDGALDDVDYANMTAPPDLFYDPAAQPPLFTPTSAQYLQLTGEILISNGALNQLADPTYDVANPGDPTRALGSGGEVFVIGRQPNGLSPFFTAPAGSHPAVVPGVASPSYSPDSALNPSITFRSIPVRGSYLLQQVASVVR